MTQSPKSAEHHERRHALSGHRLSAKVSFERALSGYGFNRAEKAANNNSALATEVLFCRNKILGEVC